MFRSSSSRSRILSIVLEFSFLIRASLANFSKAFHDDLEYLKAPGSQGQ